MIIKKIFKNIRGNKINVHGKALEPEQILRTDNIDNEIRNLVREKYLEEVDPTKQVTKPVVKTISKEKIEAMVSKNQTLK